MRPEDPLVAAARAGDRSALERLLGEHYERIHLLCRRMMADPADADDATQEALIAIAKGIRGFDGRSAFGTWAHRVTANACLDELRRRTRRPLPVDHDALHGELTDVFHDDAGPPGRTSTTADDPFQRVAERDAIDRALASIAPEFRAAVLLRDLFGYDYSEIAALLDIADGTVRSRISRGRAQLAQLLATPGTAGGPADVQQGTEERP